MACLRSRYAVVNMVQEELDSLGRLVSTENHSPFFVQRSKSCRNFKLVLMFTVYHLMSGIMSTGAVNVVRGSRSSVEELLQIYQHSERYVCYHNILTWFCIILFLSCLYESVSVLYLCMYATESKVS